MSRKRIYRRVAVKKIDPHALRESALSRSCSATTVGLDIAKDEIVVCVRWSQNEYERPWKVANPSEIGLLVELLQALDTVVDDLVIGMESTGTYGEAVRRAMTQAELRVQRVSGKAVFDYREIFDGVPSQHDGKDAAMVAELAAHGKGRDWPFRADSSTLQAVKHHTRRLDCYRKEQVRWFGRLEASLARHWPELGRLLKLNSPTLLELLAHYASPAALAKDARAAVRLRGWGGVKLTDEKIAAVLASARDTAGVPANRYDAEWIAEAAGNALSLFRQIQSVEKELKALLRDEPKMAAYIESVGCGTLAMLWATANDPRNYDSSGAYLKALGLNLKERSSGRRHGQLAISKRGPASARRWLFYWALRAIQREELKDWYEKFIQVGASGSSEHRKMKALVAMMRKLCRGLWYATKHEEPFDYAKLLQEKPRRKRRRRKGKRQGVQRQEQRVLGQRGQSLTAIQQEVFEPSLEPSGIGTTKPGTASSKQKSQEK